MRSARLTLGPILFHWPKERKLDFYARIADEAPIDTVYIGEVICSKRAPFFEEHYEEVASRLERGGKKVVLSSLCEVMLKRERTMMKELTEIADRQIEVNDASGLLHISGRPHRLGPFMNVYNEATLKYLADRGATHVCLPAELPRTAAAVLGQHAQSLGVGLEAQVYGRASLAVSARCYHARAHRRVKDNCQFVCEQDPDGMTLRTLSGQDFLAINGIQTLSHACVNLLADLPDIVGLGVGHLRLSPHTQDMVATAAVFRDVLDGRIDSVEGNSRLLGLGPPGPFANGFWHGRAGHLFLTDQS
ncbi:MAG: U32 family peptidase [Hyphomicrobiaceae bacterium]|nr:MAG: U32 family peptidase [Hyphomicrobiaceae bacterium]